MRDTLLLLLFIFIRISHGHISSRGDTLESSKFLIAVSHRKPLIILFTVFNDHTLFFSQEIISRTIAISYFLRIACLPSGPGSHVRCVTHGSPQSCFFVPGTCNLHVPTRQAKLYKWVVKRAMYGGAVIYALLTPREDLSHHNYFHLLTKTKAIPSSYAPPWANQPFLYKMRNLIIVGNFLTNITEEKTERYNV